MTRQRKPKPTAAPTATAAGQRWPSPFDAAVARLAARQFVPTRKPKRQRRSPLRAKRSIAAALRRADAIRDAQFDGPRAPTAPFGIDAVVQFPLPLTVLWLYRATLADERRSASRARSSVPTREVEQALDVVEFTPTKGRRKCAHRIVRARAMRTTELAELGYHLRQHGVNTRAAWITGATFRFNFDDESYVVRFAGADRKPVTVSAGVVREEWRAALESLAMHVASARRATTGR